MKSAKINASGKAGMKVLSVLYKAGPAAKNPRMLGCVENELGLRKFLEERGHTYVVTDSKDGDNNELDKHLPDTDILISTPFHPAFLTPERVGNAKKLVLAVTAGVGSDHIDLKSAAKAGITVAEVTGSNVVSVAEHVIMMILTLVRNYMPAHKQVIDGDWNVAEIATNAYDLENKVVGSVGVGNIGSRVLKRLQAFDCKKMLYSKRSQMSPEDEKDLCVEYRSLEDLVKESDIVTINCPLSDSTKGMFDEKLLRSMKKGAFLVNTSRGAIVDRDSLVKVLNDGHLAGYAGDVWDPQPAPKDHPWRTMSSQAMTPHYSGTTLDAQARYAAGVKEILRRTFDDEDLDPSDVIVEGGKLAGQYDDK